MRSLFEDAGRAATRAPARTPAALGSATPYCSDSNHLLSEARVRECGIVEDWIRLGKMKIREAREGSQTDGLVENGSGTGSA